MLDKTETDLAMEHIVLPDGRPMKIFLFGDTHFGFSYTLEDFEKVIKACDEEQPDLIVFVGDLIDDIKKYPGDITEISDALNRLHAPLGKYAVFGNHDYGSNGSKAYREIMTDGGFRLLVNEYAFLEAYNIVLFGIDDCLIGYGDPDILAAASPDTCNIVLCHEPDIVDRITQYNVSVMLAGHTHGGQVYLPRTSFYLPAYGEKYIRGLYPIEPGGFPLYVTRGLGTTKLPLRLFAIPEAAFISLQP